MAKKQDQQQQPSKLDAIVKECLISSSQEEILLRIPIPHTDNHSPHLSHATKSSCQPSSRDFLTVGAHHTTFYTPEETQNSDAEEEEEDSFDPKFESDRDQSLSLNTQCQHIPKSFPNFNSHPQTPPNTKSPSAREAASANSKLCNPALPEDKPMPNPSSCRRRLIGPSEKVKKAPNSPPDLGATETLTDTQVNCGQLLDTQDFDQLETQDLIDETGHGKNWVERIRARRPLPPFFSASQREISTAPCLERDFSAPTSLAKEIYAPTSLEPKRQHKVAGAKPYPETLMDVIMHCSGERPVGYEDADVLEAAINAGVTFPPPLSRHSFCK